MLYRRILKELELLLKHQEETSKDHCKYTNAQMTFITDDEIYIIILLNIYSSNYKITFKFNNEYPFKQPSVFVGNGLYKNLLMIYNNKTKKKIYETYFLDQYVCLCCITILCNWSPIVKVSALLPEIKTNIEYIHRYIEILHAEKIKYKYLIEDIPLEKYL